MSTSFPATQKSALFGRCLNFCLPVLACIIVLNTLYTIYLNYWYGPFRDMWEVFPFLVDAVESRWNWQDLWVLYGMAHRLVVPKLLYIADYQWFDGSNHLLIAISLLCQVLISLLLVSALLKRGQTFYRWSGAAILICLQFSCTLMFNFLHTFDVQWFTCCLFLVLCFYCLLAAQRHTGPVALCSLAFGILAATSNFAGMAFWPVWVVLLFKGEFSWRARVLALLVSLFFIFFYVQGMSGVSASATDEPFFHLLLAGFSLFLFPLLFMASPLSESYPVAGALFSLPALLILAIFWWMYLLRGRKFYWSTIFFAAVALACYGISVEIALGRWYGPEHYHASRYQNIVVLFWSGIFGLLCSLVREQSASAVAPGRIAARIFRLIPGYIALIFVSVFVLYQYPATTKAYAMGTNVRLAHVAFTLGHADKVSLIMATKSRHWGGIEWHHFNREYHFMRDHGVGPMAHPAYRRFRELENNAGLMVGDLPSCPPFEKLSLFTHKMSGEQQFVAATGADFMSEYAPSSIHLLDKNGYPLGYGIAYNDRSPLGHLQQVFEGRRFFSGYLADKSGKAHRVLVASGSRFVCQSVL